jgi:transposase
MAGHIQGVARGQGALLPAHLDDYIAADHVARVISAFVDRIDLAALDFRAAQTEATGRPPYHPGDLLKLYLYGYFHGCQSSRRLEAECRRNIEVKWLLGDLRPDFCTIAKFRRENAGAIVAVCAAFVQFCRQQGLLASRVAVIDGTKIRAAVSPRRVAWKSKVQASLKEIREQIGKYLAALDAADKAESNEPSQLEQAAWARQALERLRGREGRLGALLQAIAAGGRDALVRGETEARPMTCNGKSVGPAYNVQTAVSPDTHLILHFQVTQDGNDRQQLAPMAEAAQQVLGLQPAPPAADTAASPQQQMPDPTPDPTSAPDSAEPLQVLADSGYSNGEHAARCEALGIVPCAPPVRAVNSKGLFDRTSFVFDAASNTYVCPAGERMHLKQTRADDKLDTYRARSCATCALKPQCTTSDVRTVTRSWYEPELERMAQRIKNDPSLMQRRKATVEHPFGTIKTKFGGRFLTRGLVRTSAEMALQVLSYNFGRILKLRGAENLLAALA